ncbi:spondin domain-containing protein [Psychromonas ossibalaenae]|uniref:spondin domain-containing protein n=1 Tax=Psychromonas ossibalaenae TaxID=444922 RepID=UPI000376525B|nr:spondin domain-containing protein [Psychromonas ossibalaenae]
MNIITSKKSAFRTAALVVIGALLSACGGSDDKAVPMTMMDSYSYQIEVSNLTNNQPLSPLLISLNDGRFMPWVEGSSASVALEKLAEGGDNSELLTAAQHADSGSYKVISADGPTGAGASKAWIVEFETAHESIPTVHLSLAAMLVNSNDAFTGVDSLSLESLAVGDYKMNYYPAFDAGTEINSELIGSIPGPADGGTGYSETRDDIDFVHIHPGVISSDDGLADSVLNAGHKFDNPVLSIKVTRLE